MAEGRGPLLVKLGGSLITDKRTRESVRTGVLARVASELAAVRGRPGWADGGLVVGHGSGSFGHFAAAGTPLAGNGRVSAEGDRSALRAAAAATQDAAARLHRQVVAALLEAQAEPYSLPPSAWLTTDGEEVASRHLEPLHGALELGLTPVVYGDVVVDRRAGAAIASTEQVFGILARSLSRLQLVPRLAIWLGETDGIRDPAGHRVARVTADNVDAVREAAGGSGGVDVTGGMRLRLEAAWALARAGVPSWIVDGRRPGLLVAVEPGREPDPEHHGGTLIVASPR